MARIRSVKPEYWTSEQVMNMSRDARLLFIGLWTFCDDNGIHPASALSLKAEVLPGDTLAADQVMVFIDEMIEQGLVEEYEAGGRAFWRVTGWRRHQRIDQPTFRHPTGDAPSDAGDAGDAKGDRVTCVTYKRLGGKQRQIVLRKLRDRDGDACHLCGDTSNLSILSLEPNGDEIASDINNLRLICATCKRNRKQGDAKKTAGDAQGDTQAIVGDSTTEWSGVEWSGGFKEGSGNSKPKADDDSTDSGSASSSEIPPCFDDFGGTQKSAPLPMREQPPISEDPAVVLTVQLRRLGVNVMSTNPHLLQWIVDGVTFEQLAEAVAVARENKPEPEKIAPGYLVPIVQKLRKPGTGPMKKDWI